MALPAGSVRSPAKPRMRDLCQCGIGAPNKNILQMSEGRHQESVRAYPGLEVTLRAIGVHVNVFLSSIYDKENELKVSWRRTRGLIK